MAKAKGTVLVSAIRFLRANRERAEELVPPELQHYLHGQIHLSRWYPEEDLLGLLGAVLRLMPGPRDKALEVMGAHAAQEHLEGVYSHLIHGDLISYSNRAFALWGSQHDTGSFLVERPCDGEIVISVRDFGVPSEIMCGIVGGYFQETLRVGGATSIQASKQQCVLKGDAQCTWHFRHA